MGTLIIFIFKGFILSSTPSQDEVFINKTPNTSFFYKSLIKKNRKIEPNFANYFPLYDKNFLGINRGSSDNFGYLYLSSQDGDSIDFNWIEIDTTGTDLNLTDDSWTTVNLSFTFPFYDKTYNWVSIGSNGIVYFENYYIGLNNTGLPTNAYGGGDIIAVYWDDLDPSEPGAGVYFQDFGTYAVIEWDSVPIYSQEGGNSFEVILYENGDKDSV